MIDVPRYVSERVEGDFSRKSDQASLQAHLERRQEVYQEGYRLAKDLLGNLGRPMLNPQWVTPRESLIRALAQAIYQERSFQDCPVLADALEDAGCTSADMLSHLRGPGPHVRGCWALDLVLGNQ